MKNSRYEYSEQATLRSLLIGLRYAREEGKLYVVANIIKIIHHRFGRYNIQLTMRESNELLSMLRSARHGKVPLMKELPRGYQIARLIMLAMAHLPRKVRVTKRDITLIMRARVKLQRDKKNWISDELGSLRFTCCSIGLENLF